MGKNIVRFCIPSQSIQYFPHHGFFLYLLFLISLYSPTIAFGETIVAGVLADFPPQYSIDPQTGEPMGFAIDIMNDVAERLGVDVQYVLFDTWEDVQQALREQRIDIIPNMGITEDRKTWAEFTQPLEVFEICLFVRASTYDIRGVEELRGRYVSVVKINIGVRLVQDLEGAIPLVHNSASEALLSLLSGQSDAILYPAPVLNQVARKTRLEKRIKIVGKPLLEVKRAIAVRKDRPGLFRRLNDAVQEFIGTPEYQEIYTQWYGKSEPFWDTPNVLLLMGSLLIVVIIAAFLWRYYSLLRLNKLLKRTITMRKQAAKALRQSEEKYRTLFETMAQGVVYQNAEGQIISANPAAERILGLTLVQMQGRTSVDPRWEAIHEDGSDFSGNTHPAMLALKTGSEVHNVTMGVFHPKEERHHWISIDTIPQFIPGEDTPYQVYTTFSDITEQKQAELKIRHLNAVLRAIRNVNQLIVRERDRQRLIHDACQMLFETRGFSGTWIVLFDATRHVLMATEAGTGETFQAFLNQVESGNLPYCIRQGLERSDDIIIETSSEVCGDCPLWPVSEHDRKMIACLEHGGKAYGLLTVSLPKTLMIDEEEYALLKEVARDIGFALYTIEIEEKHRQAEAAVQNLARFPAENPNPVLRVTGDGIVLYANEAASAIMKKCHGTPDRKRMPEFFEVLIARSLSEETVITYDLECDDRTYAFYITPVSEHGYVNLYASDITERKRAEEELRKHREHLAELVEERTAELLDVQEELVRKEKLATLGQLAGGVAHELRNPLGAISNTIYLLNMTLKEPGSDVKEALAILKNEVETSERIINSLLNLARPGSPIQRKVNLNDVVQQTLSGFTVPGNIKIDCQLDNTLPVILVDPDQLEQVIDNLVRNAFQAMPEGGQLVIKTSKVSGNAPEPVGAAVSFTDTGIGISQEKSEKIFEPLFTTKAKGIGLGLALSKMLVEANGGTIGVESEEGQGSTFIVRLPI